MWEQQNNQLYRAFTFADFKEAFVFMSMVAELSETHNHHPTWTNTYNKVEIWLSTHSAGNTITAKDRELANAIDSVLLKMHGADDDTTSSFKQE